MSATKRQAKGTPVQQGTLTYYKSLAEMSPTEARNWLVGVRARLVAKMQRERAYLDRRAMRGTHTPTDEAYEADQVLERELLALLDDLLQGITEREV